MVKGEQGQLMRERQGDNVRKQVAVENLSSVMRESRVKGGAIKNGKTRTRVFEGAWPMG